MCLMSRFRAVLENMRTVLKEGRVNVSRVTFQGRPGEHEDSAEGRQTECVVSRFRTVLENMRTVLKEGRVNVSRVTFQGRPGEHEDSAEGRQSECVVCHVSGPSWRT